MSSASPESNPEILLAKHFGLSSFRGPQREVIQNVLDGRPTLVIMPTGGGKSLCYQLPALMLPGVTLVVSPLIALMKDQVDALQNKGIAAAMINSSQEWSEQKIVLERLRNEELKLLYIAPERFRSRAFTEQLKGIRISLFAVDEAHCISQWGHDFRPDYTKLKEALELLGRPTCIALTATATPEVQQDIEENLGLQHPQRHVSGFARKNLSFNVHHAKGKADKIRRLMDLVREHKTGIIYCATRKSVEALSESINEEGLAHVTYHGGLKDSERESAQNRFMNREVPLALATNAFGMGIDRSDIRFVIHFEIPGSIEAYYQEAGRAGRDGGPAHCELLFNYADKQVQEFFLEGANPGAELIRKVYGQLHSLADSQREVCLSNEALVLKMGRGTNPMAVSSSLSILRRMGFIERFDIPGSRIRGSRLVDPGLHPLSLLLDEQALRVKKERDEQKLKQMLRWIYASGCRQQWILRYFGEKHPEKCGRCDACRSSARIVRRIPSESELVLLKKALSGVARMSQRLGPHQWVPRFGKERIIKCLMGSQEKSISESALDQLSTWGLLRDCNQKFLQSLFQSMTDQGLLVITDGEYPLVQLSEYGSKVMMGELVPEVAWPNEKEQSGDEDSGQADESLFRILKAKRNQMARSGKKTPAYTIFPDTVLRHLATRKPTTVEEALLIKGIGPAKAKNILPVFLELIREYLTAN
jgi:ATP-dependent DNA helicase RecQ